MPAHNPTPTAGATFQAVPFPVAAAINSAVGVCRTALTGGSWSLTNNAGGLFSITETGVVICTSSPTSAQTYQLGALYSTFQAGAAANDNVSFSVTPSAAVVQALGVTGRNPTATDDTTKGYAVGQTWLNKATGHVWQATSVAAGTAAWSDITPSALPGDVLTAAGATLYGVFGMKRLVAAYTGPLINVQRDVDGATQDIGQVQDASGKWVLDVAGLIAFLGGVPPLITNPDWYTHAGNGSVTKVYEQSGSGNHATQTSAFFMPRLHLQQLTGGVPSILMMVTPMDQVRTAAWLNLPATLTVPALTNSSVFTVGRVPSLNRPFGIARLAGATNLDIANASNQQLRFLPGGTPARFPSVTAFVASMTATATNTGRVYHDDVTVAIATGIPTTGTAGGTWGGAAGNPVAASPTSPGTPPTSVGNYEASALIIASGVSNAVQDQVNAALDIAFGVCPQIRDTVVMTGDSLVDGQVSGFFRTTPRQAEPQFAKPCRVINWGVSGQTSYQEVNRFATTLALIPGTIPGAQIVMTEQAGCNDLAIYGGAWKPDSTTWSLTLPFCSNAGNYYRVTAIGYLSATVVSGGTGLTNGVHTFTGTTGAGAKVQVSGTVAGGVLSGALTIVSPGAYTTAPTNINAEPVAVDTGGATTAPTIKLVAGTTSVTGVKGPTATGAGATELDGGLTWTWQGALPGALANDIYSRLTSLVTSARAAGYDKVGLVTVLKRGDYTSVEAPEWLALAPITRANAACADFIVDPVADLVTGDPLRNMDKLWFYTDTVHPVDCTHARLATIYAQSVNANVVFAS